MPQPKTLEETARPAWGLAEMIDHCNPATRPAHADADDDDDGNEGDTGTPYTWAELSAMVYDGIAEAIPCGCQVETDGHCPCGNPSALLVAEVC